MRGSVSLAALAILAAGAPAQRQFEVLAKHHLPTDYDSTWAVALDDVNGDGVPDLVLGNGGASVQQNRLYLNDGGELVQATWQSLPVFVDATYGVATGDVDGDGDRDLAFANNGQNRLCTNDGLGVFTEATSVSMPVDNDSTRAVALGDVDGDGDLAGWDRESKVPRLPSGGGEVAP